MFKGLEALGWFGGKLQYHAILRWKKEKKPTEVILEVTTKTAKQFLLSIKHEDLKKSSADQSKACWPRAGLTCGQPRADVRPA